MSHNYTNRTMWRSFVCALVAVVTLSVRSPYFPCFHPVTHILRPPPQAMNPYRTGKLVLFQVSYDRGWHYFEIPFYILIGVFGVST